MNTRWMLATGRLAALAVILPIAVAASAETKDSAAITSRLAEIKTHAALASDDAATLESYTRSKLSWQAHEKQLTRMKGHVNDIVADYKTLDSLRAEGSQWQQEAIDRIEPMLREIADTLTATITHLNDNPSKIHMQPFRDYVNANAKLLDTAHRTVNDLVDYGEARAKSDQLQKTLELPESAELEK